MIAEAAKIADEVGLDHAHTMPASRQFEWRPSIQPVVATASTRGRRMNQARSILWPESRAYAARFAFIRRYHFGCCANWSTA